MRSAVRDIEDNEIVLVRTPGQSWTKARSKISGTAKTSGVAMQVQTGHVTVHGTNNAMVRVSTSETIPVGGIVSISILTIKSDDNPSGLVVYATVSAPGKRAKKFDPFEIRTCLSYVGNAEK